MSFDPKAKLVVTVLLLSAFIILNGCTEEIPGIPFTTSQLINQSTDLNYILFKQGYYDGNCLGIDVNKITVKDCNGGGVTSVNWSDILGFPAGCPSGEAVRIVGATLTCIPVGGADTNWQTSWAEFDANMKATYRLPWVDTNAETACGDNEYLRGDGTCQVISAGGFDSNVYGIGILRKDTNSSAIDWNVSKVNPQYVWDDNSSHNARAQRVATKNKWSFYNTINAPGGAGGAIGSFTDGNYVTVNDDNAFSFTDGNFHDSNLTFCAWVNVTTLGVNETFFAKGSNSGTGTTEYSTYINSGNQYGLSLYSNVSGNYIGRYGGSATIGWHFVCFTYDGSGASTGIKVYEDTAQVDTLNFNNGSYVGMPNSTNKLYIGKLQWSGGYNMRGSLDELLIFNRVLSSSEMATLYNTGTGALGDITQSPWNNGLVAGWHLDEGTGTAPQDFSGNARHASFVGTPSWTTGKITLPATTKEVLVFSHEDGKSALGEGIFVTGNGLSEIDLNARNDSYYFNGLTSNGFLRTQKSNGNVWVDSNSYALTSQIQTDTNVWTAGVMSDSNNFNINVSSLKTNPIISACSSDDNSNCIRMTRSLTNKTGTIDNKVLAGAGIGADLTATIGNGTITANTGAFTIAFWSYRTGACSATSAIIDVGTYTALTGYGVWLDSSCLIQIRRQNDYSTFTTNDALALNTWEQWIITRDTSNNVTVYKNNVSVHTFAGYASPATTTALALFGRSDAGGKNFVGYLDEVYIFNRVITAGERATIYGAGSGYYGDTGVAPFNSGLLVGYHMDERSGSTATDFSGNGGTLNLTSPSWTDGKVAITGSLQTIKGLQIKNGVNSNELATIQMGDYSGNFGTSNIFEGLNHKWNILGIQKEILDVNGNHGFGTATPTTKVDIAGDFNSGSSFGRVKFDSNGNLTLFGEATQWNDMLVPLTSVKLAGVKDPDFTDYLGVGTYAYEFQDNVLASEDEVFFTLQMSHAYRLGSNFSFHLHNTPDANNGLVGRFGLTCSKAEYNGLYSTTTQYKDINYATRNNMTNYLDSFTAPYTCSTISCILNCKLFRNSSDTNDTYTSGIYVESIDAHYEMDSLGSNSELTK